MSSKARPIPAFDGTPVSFDERVGLIYTRVSTLGQVSDGNGLFSQEERCLAHLKALRIPHEKTFRDAYTGAGDFMSRPAMREMLSYIDANPHKKFVVVFDDIKRLSRDLKSHIELRYAFRERDVIPLCPNYNFDEAPESIFMENLFAGQGQLEREQNRRQVIQKMKARLEAGYWTFGTKKGYDMVKHPGRGKVAVPNKEGLEMLKPAMEAFASGELVRKIDVCRYLVEKGFWKKQPPDKYIDKMTDLFSDPFYMGDIEYPVWGVGRRKGQHEGIISAETFDLIQKRLKREGLGKQIRTDISPDFPLRGLLVCESCERHLTGTWTNRKKRGGYPYYYCQNRGCDKYGKMLRRAVVEEDFKHLLQSHKLKPEVGELVEAVFERVWNAEIKSLKDKERSIQRQIASMEARESELVNASLGAKSGASRRAYESELERVSNALVEIRKSKPISDEMLDTTYRNSLKKATGLLKSPYSVWKSLDVREQHRLFFLLFEGKLVYSRTEAYRNAKNLSSVRLFEEFAVANPLDVEVRRVELRSESCFKSESTTRS